jgi:serine/threonine protein phosphatase 1
LQTLASFEIAGISETSSGDTLTKARDQLVHAMGASMLTWLRQRPTYWQSGNVAVTHAGADPNLPLADQPTQALHWGHRDFETTQRRDGVWVVHGHTIVDAPYEKNGRIAIDTGAYATGRLTAVLVEDAEVHFETITI